MCLVHGDKASVLVEGDRGRCTWEAEDLARVRSICACWREDTTIYDARYMVQHTDSWSVQLHHNNTLKVKGGITSQLAIY